MSEINIGIPIDLQKLLDTRLLIQAGSGGGKSYALRKVIESIGNKVQQIIIDPEGEFVTLREKFDFALVSKGGDIPLSLKYAETLAHKILETGVSVIIDLYELPQHERILFVKRFLQAVINVPKELWHPCFIHIDEAHIFCPESSKSESTAAVIDLCTRGRKRGFCAVLATQRLPKLNKDATAECNNKMVGRTAQDIDRKRAGEELGMYAKADILSIRDLQPGQFYTYGPAISSKVIEFRVSPVTTTHLQSGKRMISAPPTPKAIEKILSKLSDIPEEAARELHTKEQLQAEVTKLRTELNKKPKLNQVIPGANDKQIEQARKEVRDQYAGVVKERDSIIVLAQKQIKVLQATMAKICQMAGGEPTKLPSVPNVPEIRRTDTTSRPAPAGKAVVIRGDGTLGKCSKAIISFLAGHQDRDFTKAQISVFTGYSSTSSGFQNSMSELNTRGFIIRGARISVNPDALNAITEAIGEIAVHEFNVETFKGKLGKCEREIYDILLEHPNEVFTKEVIAEMTPSGYSSTSSGFQNSLSTLATLELMVREKGQIKLNPDLLELM